MFRIGQGFDVHPFALGRKLILGGVVIPHEMGLLGHSDADVLIHALMDALLGACALGDIGRHFPDTDQQFLNVDSRVLLCKVVSLLKEQGSVVVNVDMTVIAQSPKLAPFLDEIRSNLSGDLGIASSRISIKATTTEHLGFIGRKEGIAAQAVVLIDSSDN
ncbi:MAG: 2-C-methyl-D-erythritol 2,4-cyclodiphosphate synthase [Proteobacteria bacterium]|nr:2-C-methyl-D-erythritol 2,4-cyclodiphosphate synthase [Pseudomonadota bacterium]